MCMRQAIRWAPLLLLAGCSGLLLHPGSGGRQPDVPAALPGDATAVPGSLRSSTGCRVDYRVYSTTEARPSELVVLAHGFLRSQDRMQRLAARLAATGTRAATLDFCNQRPWSGGHVQNGRDMIAVARALGAERVVYAGFSAGGLAALLAGRNDPNAVGIVTLDLVETQGLGVAAARDLDKPLLGLTGEPTNCNALDNAGAVFAATDQAQVVRIHGAGHCDFEAPTDALCELICSDPDNRPVRRSAGPLGATERPRERILDSATLAVRSLLGDDMATWHGSPPRPPDPLRAARL